MTAEKIKKVLTDLGYNLTDFGNHWRTNALYRGGSNNTAIKVYKDTGVWVDYVQDGAYLPFETLIEATIKTNDKVEIEKILGGYDFDLPTHQETKAPKIEMEKTYPDSILEKLLPHYKFYNNKGIPDDVLKSLKSGMAMTGSMYQRYVFPIYNQMGQICGFSGRDMSGKKDGRPKWKHTGKKSQWIYPYYVPSEPAYCTKSYISSIEEVVLIESIGDLLKLRSFGVGNALVIFGTSISSSMICFLVSLQLKRVIISLNNDFDKEINRGEIGSLKSYLKLLNYFDKDKIVIHLPNKSDFGEMNEEDFSKWSNDLKNLDLKDQQNDLHDKILNLVESGHIPKGLYKKKFFS